ncbi:hypothetical protein KL938_001129 [Ogataea parapolymorpha]|nr:hypothetical protein KL938_001129 [Ogataea parapolymorpha]
MLGQGAFAMLLNFQQLADLLQNEPALIKVTALLSQESLQVVAALLQLGSVYVAMSLLVKDALGIDVPAGDHGCFPVRAVPPYRLAGLPNHKHHLLICVDRSHNILSAKYLHFRNTYPEA